jgi:hypothetical protein
MSRFLDENPHLEKKSDRAIRPRLQIYQASTLLRMPATASRPAAIPIHRRDPTK